MLFVLAGIKVCQIISTVRFSFLTLHFTDNWKTAIGVVLLVCMECFQGSSCLTRNCAVAFVPESEYKGKTNFRTAKIFQGYFSWKIKLFSTDIDFQRVIKWKKIWKKRRKGESLCQASESQVYLSFYSERSQGSSPWSGVKGESEASTAPAAISRR